MTRSALCLLAVLTALSLTSADGIAATKKKTRKVVSNEPTRAEIYQYCKMLIKKYAGASTTVYRARRLSTGKIQCVYAW